LRSLAVAPCNALTLLRWLTLAPTLADVVADVGGWRAVTAGKFRNRILDFDFNREILGRKHFGFWKTESSISENRFYQEIPRRKQIT
jgi:hypothetical protein